MRTTVTKAIHIKIMFKIIAYLASVCMYVDKSGRYPSRFYCGAWPLLPYVSVCLVVSSHARKTDCVLVWVCLRCRSATIKATVLWSIAEHHGQVGICFYTPQKPRANWCLSGLLISTTIPSTRSAVHAPIRTNLIIVRVIFRTPILCVRALALELLGK